MTTTTDTRYVFTAFFDNGDIHEWPAHCSYSYVFKLFKWSAQIMECNGRLYCGHRLIRTTGDFIPGEFPHWLT